MDYYLFKMLSNNDNTIKRRLKIVLLGSVGTGKTIFCMKVKNNYVDKNMEYISTTGASYFSTEIIIENLNLYLEFWDTSGQERFKALNKFFYKDADIICIFYNSYDISSFERAKIMIKTCKENTYENTLLVLIRSRYDECLQSNYDKNIISDEEALEYADLNNLYFTHVSSFEKNEFGYKELIKIFLKKIKI